MAYGAVVEGNRIDDVSAISVTAYAIGMKIDYSSYVLVRGNSISSATDGLYFESSTGGKYMDNLTSNVTTPFTGGTAVGTNN